MSTHDVQMVTAISQHVYDARSQKWRKRWLSFWHSPTCMLWPCLLLAIVVRVILVIHTHGVIDGDEALVGIQAQHIVRGERPIYFYGIPYFGSLEAYLVALVFIVAGSSVWTLRAEPILLSLVIVWLTWRLAAALADFARLPLAAKRQFMLVATLLAAVFPLYDTVLELHTFGGYVEIFVLMQLLLLGTLQLTRRWSEGASNRELALRWATLGFVVGLGLWVDPLIVSAVLVTVLWILGYSIFVISRAWRESSTSPWQAIWAVCKKLLLAVATIPSALIGGSPALYWGAAHQWQNITYILNLGNGYSSLDPATRVLYPTRFALTTGLVKLYTTCVAPRVIGGALPAESGRLLTMLHTFTLAAGVFSIVTTIALVVLSLVMCLPLLVQMRQLATLPLLFALSTAFFFSTSTAAVSGLGCTRDLAGRYATPLMLALPFFFATTFIFIHLLMQRYFAPVPGVLPNLQRGQAHGSRSSSQHSPVPTGLVLQTMLFLLFFVYLGAQAATYRLSDAGHTFQSPYCTHAPALNDTIIAYLQQHHIRYAWAVNWVGYPIIFKTGGRIALADPQPVMKNLVYFNRFPADVTAVLHADRASFLVIVKHGDRHPQLLRLFDAQRITYSAVFFPSQPEADILLVTPLSRTVSPFEPGPYFDIFHCSS
jgi:hypothetical protein